MPSSYLTANTRFRWSTRNMEPSLTTNYRQYPDKHILQKSLNNLFVKTRHLQFLQLQLFPTPSVLPWSNDDISNVIKLRSIIISWVMMGLKVHANLMLGTRRRSTAMNCCQHWKTTLQQKIAVIDAQWKIVIFHTLHHIIKFSQHFIVVLHHYSAVSPLWYIPYKYFVMHIAGTAFAI